GDQAPWTGEGGLLCRPAACVHQPDAVLQCDDPRRHQRRDLAERVSGEGGRLAHTLLRRLPGEERGQEHSQLSRPRPVEHLGGLVEQERCQWCAERGLGAIDDRPRRIVSPFAAHPGRLYSLSREQDRQTHVLSPDLVDVTSIPSAPPGTATTSLHTSSHVGKPWC